MKSQLVAVLLAVLLSGKFNRSLVQIAVSLSKKMSSFAQIVKAV